MLIEVLLDVLFGSDSISVSQIDVIKGLGNLESCGVSVTREQPFWFCISSHSVAWVLITYYTMLYFWHRTLQIRTWIK